MRGIVIEHKKKLCVHGCQVYQDIRGAVFAAALQLYKCYTLLSVTESLLTVRKNMLFCSALMVVQRTVFTQPHFLMNLLTNCFCTQSF